MRMILAASLAIVPMMAKDNENAKRLDHSATVFSEIIATPDKGYHATWSKMPAALSLFLI
jgi:hypothetical protein